MFHVKQAQQETSAILDGVSRETRARLATYAGLLTRWNARINLISPGDIDHLWDRHIADALQLAPLIPPDASHAVDLGSGSGVPGLVLAICTGIHVHLVEADQRKAAFLREAVRATGTGATVHPGRAEDITLPPAPLVTARALAPLPRLLSLAAPFLAPDGFCLFPKGRSAASELTDAAREWQMTVTQFPSRTRQDAIILKISHLTRV